MARGVPVRRLGLVVLASAVLALLPLAAVAGRASADGAPAVPSFTHVVEVVLENESASSTFENPAAEPALAQLRQTGVYIPNFYGVGHQSLDNYEAAFAAVQPTSQGEADCLGMSYGSCIFPASVPTFGALLDAHSLAWKVYNEGMAGAPGGGNCLHAPSRSGPDPYQGPLSNGYATRHNPVPWFDSVLLQGGSEAYCQAHSVDLGQFWQDAQSPATLPAWSMVVPDTCHDGHDPSCAADPEGLLAPAGTAAIDAWLPGFVSKLTSSPAWDAGSVLVITFDEGASSDTAGCGPCGDGSAGGRIGALVIGAKVASPGTVSDWSGDHYSLLRTWETAWGLPTLKSIAASPGAAASVHDGDAGVLPLTGIWTAPPASGGSGGGGGGQGSGNGGGGSGGSGNGGGSGSSGGTSGGSGQAGGSGSGSSTGAGGGQPAASPSATAPAGGAGSSAPATLVLRGVSYAQHYQPGARTRACGRDPIWFGLPGRGNRRAVAYLGRRQLVSERGTNLRSLTIIAPPAGAFALRIVITGAHGSKRTVMVRVSAPDRRAGRSCARSVRSRPVR